jgi:tetraacyldisaccharide 4'-kinase
MKAPAFWSAPPGLRAAALTPLGALYEWAGKLRRARTRSLRLPVPVICVGNLTAGGTGKTPVVLSLLRMLAAQGINPHALSRGYGGSATGPLRVDPARHRADVVGDEPLLLAGAAPAWVARDRAAGGQAAVAAGAGCIVMDDGHQNPALHKDLSLIVADGAAGFGNRRVIPAGPLRESVAAGLARADAVIVIGEDFTGEGGHDVARDVAAAGLPLLRARLVPDADAAARLKGRKVVAFAGIGRPEKFFATLREIGAEVTECVGFPDHHPFTAGEIAALAARAAGLNAQLVTTVKDLTRLPADLPADLRAGVAVLPVDLLWSDPAALEALLHRLDRR